MNKTEGIFIMDIPKIVEVNPGEARLIERPAKKASEWCKGLFFRIRS